MNQLDRNTLVSIVQIQDTVLDAIVAIINNDNQASDHCKELVTNISNNAKDHIKLLEGQKILS